MKRCFFSTLIILIGLFCTNIAESYNNKVWKQSVNKVWAESVGVDRPEPPHTIRAHTKATTTLDFDYHQEHYGWNGFWGINDINYESYAYIRATGRRGTWSMKVSASQSSDNFDDEGKWWSGIYKEKRARHLDEFREKDEDGNFIVDLLEENIPEDQQRYFAIDYFYLTEAKASVSGTTYYGSGSEDESPERTKFSSEAEAKKFQNTAGIKWWCKRSGQNHYYEGKPCRMCNP